MDIFSDEMTKNSVTKWTHVEQTEGWIICVKSNKYFVVIKLARPGDL
jgi:hypothetical protein